MARSLVAAAEPVGVRVPGWDRFPTTVGEALKRDLRERYRGIDLVRVRDLLWPLAYAEGAGLPRQLWPLLANTLTEGHYTQGDIGWLLEHAGAYLVEAVEDGRSAYRRASHLLPDATNGQRTAYLELVSCQVGDGRLADHLRAQ